jgi:2-isopropylmalate synthase
MKKVIIADTTLCQGEYTFKEKLEIARLLEALGVDAIELPALTAAKTDEVLVRTMASVVRLSKLSVAASSDETLATALSVLDGVGGAIIRVEVPVSTVGMEYFHQKKAPKMVEWIGASVRRAKQAGYTVEFCAKDATRAEKEVLLAAVKEAEAAGADYVTVCDDLGETLPDELANSVGEIAAAVKVPVGVRSVSEKGLAIAQAVLAVKAGAGLVKAGVDCPYTDLETLVKLLHDAAQSYGVTLSVDATKLHRIVKQIREVHTLAKAQVVPSEDSNILLNDADDKEKVMEAVAKIGYDISEQEQDFVYEEFLRVAKKKKVGAKELGAIVDSVTTQYPTVYKLDSYVINNGNIITSSAQITVLKDNAVLHGVSIGDGPIDASFRALEQIVGAHYELDDFQIHAVTEGREAVGQAQVKLRAEGKVFIGNGVSTDIIGASIRAYLSAVNKIVYEGL